MLELTLPWPPKELSPNARVHWAPEEEDYLREFVNSMSHARIGEFLGRTKKAVTNRCWALGLVDRSTQWTDEQVKILTDAYARSQFATEIDLTGLAKGLGKNKANVCRKARSLGLTDQSRKELPPEVRKVRKPKFSTQEERSAHMSSFHKNRIAKDGHPRGMLGLHHTDSAKEAISAASIRSNARCTPEQKAQRIMKAMKTKVANGTYVNERVNASWKSGWREIGGIRKYYRSKWEANYAYYLQWLKEKGNIKDWLHEPTTFWFVGVKRGCVSYLPDFWVLENSGSEAYHEVKGWMDDRSKTKIRRMAKYHPSVKLVVIDGKGYAALKKSVQGLVPGWES